MSVFEIRWIVYSLLVLQIVLVFGVLRLFNAVVNTNRLIIKLKESIMKLDSRILSLEKRDAKNLGDLKIALNSVSLSIKQMILKLSTLYDGLHRKNNAEDFSNKPKKDYNGKKNI